MGPSVMKQGFSLTPAMGYPNYCENPKPEPTYFQNAPEGCAIPPKTTAEEAASFFCYINSQCFPVEGGRADGRTEAQKKNVTPRFMGTKQQREDPESLNLGIG